MIGTGCSKKEGKYLTYTYFLLIFFIISCVTTHIIFSLYLSCSNYIYHYSNNKVCIVGMTYRFLSLLLKRAAWFTTIPGIKGKLASKGLELYTLQKFPGHHSFLFLHVSPKTTQGITAISLNHQHILLYPKFLFNYQLPPPTTTLIPSISIWNNGIPCLQFQFSIPLPPPPPSFQTKPTYFRPNSSCPPPPPAPPPPFWLHLLHIRRHRKRVHGDLILLTLMHLP